MLDNPGIALFLDCKKAFDSLEWNFIKKALKTFNFGTSLIRASDISRSHGAAKFR